MGGTFGWLLSGYTKQPSGLGEYVRYTGVWFWRIPDISRVDQSVADGSMSQCNWWAPGQLTQFHVFLHTADSNGQNNSCSEVSKRFQLFV